MKIFENKIDSSDSRVKSVLDSLKTKQIITQNKDDLSLLDSILNDENLGKHTPVLNNDYYLPTISDSEAFLYQGGYFQNKSPELNSLIENQFIIQKNRKIKINDLIKNGSNNIKGISAYTQDLNLNSIFMNSFVQTTEKKNTDIFGPVERRIVTSENGEAHIEENKYETASSPTIKEDGTYFRTTKEMFYIDEDFWTSVDGVIQKHAYQCNWVSSSNIGRDNSKGLFKGDDLKAAWEALLSKAKDSRNTCFLYYDGVYYRYRDKDDAEKYFYNEKDDEKSDFFLPTNDFQRDNAIMFIESEDASEPPEVVLYSLSETEASATGITEELYFYKYESLADVTQDDYEQSYYPKTGAVPAETYKLFSISIDEEPDDDQCLSKTNFKDGTYFLKKVNLSGKELYNMGFESLDFDNGLILTEAYKKDINDLLKPFYIDSDETKQNYILKEIQNSGVSEYQLHKIYLKDTESTDLLQRNLNGPIYSYNKEHNAYFIKDKENIKNIATNISDIIKNMSLENTRTSYGNLYSFLKAHANIGLFINDQIIENINGYENQNSKDNDLKGYWKLKSFDELNSLNEYETINGNRIYKSFLNLESNPAFRLFKNNGKYNFIRIKDIPKKGNEEQKDFFEPVQLSFTNNLNKKYLINSNIYFYNEVTVTDSSFSKITVKYFYKIDYADNKIDLIYVPIQQGKLPKPTELKFLIKDAYNGYNEKLYKFELRNRKGYFVNDNDSLYKSFSVNIVSDLTAGRILEDNEEVICDGKIYIVVTFPSSSGNKKFLVEKIALSSEDYIEFNNENLSYNSAYNCFSKEMNDGEIYQIFKTITSQDDLSIFNYETGPRQIPETYRYSRKIHGFYNDQFLKVYEKPLYSFLIYPRVAFRSRLNSINSKLYFEGIGSIEEDYIKSISSKLYFNNNLDKSSEGYILEKEFIDQKDFPVLYRIFNTTNHGDYQNNIIKNISETLYNPAEDDLSNERPSMSNGSWCAFNSLNSQIFNDQRDNIIQAALNGNLNSLNLTDIERYLEMFSKEVVYFIERKEHSMSEEKMQDLKIAVSDLQLSFTEFQQLFNEVSSNPEFSEYFVNIGDIFKKIWDYSNETINTFKIDFSKYPAGYCIYETYRYLLDKIKNIDPTTIDNIETIKIIEFFYLLTIFFEEENKVLEINVLPEENEDPNNAKISSINLIIYMDEDSEETAAGLARITFINNADKISYSIPITNFSNSQTNRAICWKDKRDNPEIQIEIGDNGDVLITEKISSKLNNQNKSRIFSGIVDENVSAIKIKENLKMFYSDCRRFRYQYAFMIYQLTTNENNKFDLSRYQFEDYKLI